MTPEEKAHLDAIIEEVFAQVTPELLAWVNAQTWTEFQIPASQLKP